MTDSTNRSGGKGPDRVRSDRDEVRSERVGADRDEVRSGRDEVRSERVGADQDEPDGTFTDEEYEEGTNTVEHGEEHSQGGDYTDTDFTEDETDRAKRHD
jgi:hypothetical protein